MPAIFCCVAILFSPQRKVQLLSPDKQTFEVEWDVAMRSAVVKQMLEGKEDAWCCRLMFLQGGLQKRACLPAWLTGHFFES